MQEKHQATEFGEKLTTIYVEFQHTKESPCANAGRIFRYPVVNVGDIKQAIATARNYELYCRRCHHVKLQVIEK